MKDKYVPDTSAIIDGVMSNMIEKKELTKGEILIHQAVISELENQANRGRDVGLIGLKEIQKLKEIIKDKKDIKVEFKGKRPKEFEIKYAKSGEIDAMIRDLAIEENAIFITLDRVDAEAAKAQGLEVIFIEADKEEKALRFKEFFDNNTMSVHLREGLQPNAKKGTPGNWQIVSVGNEILEKEELEEIAQEIIEKAKTSGGGSFIETERRGSVIAQIDDFRIVIVKPPFADGWEITIVHPIKKMELKDYKIPKKLKDRFETTASGILISGAPGHGKSTFAEALSEFYMRKGKVVKTVEAPRDLRLPQEITQYSKALGTTDEIKDVLLLSRPDYTIFDEMRSSKDFYLYSDLRLAGVGMVGIVHATSPIDSIQRFIRKIELGMIPSIIDTVIFIENGKIKKVYSLVISVKVPSGMTESDLARPLIEIKDFFTNAAEYEIYTFGEETVVMPVTAKENVEDDIKRILGMNDLKVEIRSGVANIYANKSQVKRIIGKGGKRIKNLEREIGVPIEVFER